MKGRWQDKLDTRLEAAVAEHVLENAWVSVVIFCKSGTLEITVTHVHGAGGIVRASLPRVSAVVAWLGLHQLHRIAELDSVLAIHSETQTQIGAASLTLART